MRKAAADLEAVPESLIRTDSGLAFSLWSSVYDDAPNPLLSLEQRFLTSLLPEVSGLDLLDAGCGTGRWLELLATRSPKTLIGIDASPAMLERASHKVCNGADLRLGDCGRLPVGRSSVDLALSSFVLSYLPCLTEFAQSVERSLRPGGSLFLTDMHPETASRFEWKRSFRAEGAPVEIEAEVWAIEQIVHVFESIGLQTISIVEPAFEESERRIFARCGKIEDFRLLEGVPAIYVLAFRKETGSKGTGNKACHRPPSHDAGRAASIIGTRFALGASQSGFGSISLESGRIRRMCSRPLGRHVSPHMQATLDLSGYLLLPGLINAHDHLEFGLFPNLGRGSYQNSTDWAEEIHRVDAPLIELHRKVPKDVALWWGGIRNLLCGATTVCHHNPLAPELSDPSFPVRVVARFGWAHSLRRDADIVGKHRDTPRDMPFLLHAGEGIDARSAGEIFDLDRMKVLDNRTILVHGLALSTEGISLLNRRGAALIVCPTSNQFLFGRVLTSECISSLAQAALGSDSPLTAEGDLLDEVRFASCEIGVDVNKVYEMVTSQPAKMLRLQEGEGSLRPGAAADLVAVRDRGLAPAVTLANLKWEEIELVMLSARVQLASPAIIDRLSPALRSELEPLEVDGHIRWIRAPVKRLFAEAKKVLGAEIRLGKKQVRLVDHK